MHTGVDVRNYRFITWPCDALFHPPFSLYRHFFDTLCNSDAISRSVFASCPQTFEVSFRLTSQLLFLLMKYLLRQLRMWHIRRWKRSASESVRATIGVDILTDDPRVMWSGVNCQQVYCRLFSVPIQLWLPDRTQVTRRKSVQQCGSTWRDQTMKYY